ncbi:hypothetical protein ACJX0J_023464, partial [Zea mays]
MVQYMFNFLCFHVLNCFATTWYLITTFDHYCAYISASQEIQGSNTVPSLPVELGKKVQQTKGRVPFICQGPSFRGLHGKAIGSSGGPTVAFIVFFLLYAYVFQDMWILLKVVTCILHLHHLSH